MAEIDKVNKNHIINSVISGSPSDIAGIKAGDVLVSINGESVKDVFDYRFSVLNKDPKVIVIRDGKEIEFTVIKDEDDELGIEFENGLMDEYRRCRNNCIFCFIDQMPPGMRKTLYFKDDDSRLSFLQGNYVTLTNLTDSDVERIIKYRMEPINISFQTTNPELRCKMLNNRFAGDCLKYADAFYDAEITMNGQIVLCKGINDGDELIRTIEDLSKYLPVLESVSIVPVGLSKYRDGLYPLEPFTKEDAIKVISLVEGYQKKFYEKFGLHFIHCSDEWYILAGKEVPGELMYDGYLQLENGVGMVRLLLDEFAIAMKECRVKGIKKLLMRSFEATLVTGKLAYPYIKKLADLVMNDYPKIKLDVVAIRNDFFGENITVSGLLTGRDIINQLKEHGYKHNLIIPRNMLKAGEDVFLDDVTLESLKNELQVNVIVNKQGGRELFRAMLGHIRIER